MADQLAERTPDTTLDHLTDWTRLDADSRKRRAAEAVRDADLDTLDGLIDAYAARYCVRGTRVSPNTLAVYRRGMRTLVRWCEGNAVKPHQLDSDTAALYRAHLQEHGAEDGGALSTASVNARLSAAKAFVLAMAWCGLMPKNLDPFARTSVKVPTPASEKVDAFDDAELARLLDTADDRMRALVVLGCDAGLRIGEVRNLRWEDVDFSRKRLTVREGKGGKVGSVRVTQRVLDALTSLGREKTGYVFPATKGTGGIDKRHLQRLFGDLCDRANVQRRGVHALRHACGVRLHRLTRDLQAVARHLRHATVETARIYAVLADSDYEAAIDALDFPPRVAA